MNGSPRPLLQPPRPPEPIRIELPEDPEAVPDLRAIPSRPGVFALEDADGGTIALSVTADLRRRVRARLTPPPADAAPTRQIDYRSVTRVVRFVPVGSSFEADWAYLQLARERLPATYRSMLDRWKGWFIHCDADASFPRLVKTNAPRDAAGIFIGPFADKHAAQRAIETVEDLFDLCRYYHILVESPRGAACAYKEMGKCPAPCDGSVSMDVYRRAIGDAVGFLGGAVTTGIAAIEERMRAASVDLDFEDAERQRRRAAAARGLTAAPFRFVDRLDRFRFLYVLPSEAAGHARLVLIAGGWIAPWVDVPLDLAADGVDAVVSSLDNQPGEASCVLSDAYVENIGLVCWHLFHATKDGTSGAVLPIGHGLEPSALQAALTRLARRAAKTEVPERE